MSTLVQNPNANSSPNVGGASLVVSSGNGAAIVLALHQMLEYYAQLMKNDGAAAVLFAQLNSNPNDSFYKSFQDQKNLAAQQQGDSIRTQATGEIVAGSVGLGVGVIGAGINEFVNSRYVRGQGMSEKLDGAQQYKDAFREEPESELVGTAEKEKTEGQATAEKNNKVDINKDVQARMEQIEDGRYDGKNFRGRNKNGEISDDDQTTKDAIQRMTKSSKTQKNAINQANENIKDIQTQQQSLQAAKQEWAQLLNQATSGLNEGAKGVAGLGQAASTTEAGEADASATLTGMFNENNNNQQGKASSHQEADSAAMDAILQQLTSALLSSTRAGGAA